MKQQANKVDGSIIKANKQIMSNIREILKVENEKCGQKVPCLIRAESELRYNNPIFNCECMPFQCATQVRHFFAKTISPKSK